MRASNTRMRRAKTKKRRAKKRMRCAKMRMERPNPRMPAPGTRMGAADTEMRSAKKRMAGARPSLARAARGPLAVSDRPYPSRWRIVQLGSRAAGRDDRQRGCAWAAAGGCHRPGYGRGVLCLGKRRGPRRDPPHAATNTISSPAALRWSGRGKGGRTTRPRPDEPAEVRGGGRRISIRSLVDEAASHGLGGCASLLFAIIANTVDFVGAD